MADTSPKSRKALFEKRLAESKSAHNTWRLKWRRNDEVYHGYQPTPKTTKDLLRSQVRVPWAYQQVETIIPRVMIADPRFEFQPVEKNDQQMSDVLNALVRWQLRSDRFVSKQRPIILDSIVRGIGVAKVIWLRSEREMPMRVQQNMLERTLKRPQKTEAKRVIVENRPSILYVDLEDFFPDPAATSDENWNYVFHRSWLSMEDLKARQAAGIYQNVDKIKGPDYDESVYGVRELPAEAKARRGDKVAVYEGWFSDGTKMVMAGDQVLQDMQNPYYHGEIPFKCFSTQPDPRSLVGISEVEKIAPIQEAIWTKDNQRIDAVNLALKPIFVLDPTIQGWRSLELRPGTKIPANMGQRIEQFRIDPNQAPAFAETEAMIGAMQHITGASPYLAGADPATAGVQQNTATGASILQEEGNKRMQLKQLEYHLFLARIAKLVVQLNHQYLSELEIQRIVGDDAIGYKPPAPEEIPMFLDVIPEAMDESMNKMQERNSQIELLNVLGPLHGSPMEDGTSFTIKPQIKSLLKSYGKIPNDSFSASPAPAPEQQGPPQLVPPQPPMAA